jgi:uncharacterized protein (DUF488 family)
MQVYSLGHSSRSIEALIALAREAGVSTIVDVRLVPASRRWP